MIVNNDKQLSCNICQRQFSSYKSLSSHIRQTHNVCSKDYYDKYLKSKNEGICKTCGNETAFKKISTGYCEYCSEVCTTSSIERNMKISKSISNNTEHLNNSRNRLIAYNKSEKGRAQSSKNGKIWGPISLKKAHKLYDTIEYCPVCNKETKHIIGHGCAKCWSISAEEKMKISTREKYNVDNVFQLDCVKEKIKQASLEKYGVENPGNSREARIKAAETMRKNGNYSSWEDVFENKLKELNIRYETQYNKDERYPFQCDFYLIDEDAFIEINGYWTHNNHFFDKNNKDDIETLNKWKEKAKQGHKQFANAVEVWSNKDVLKRDMAIKNNLNYIVLWNLDDILAYNYYLNDLYGGI